MQRHRIAISLVLILILSLSCRILVPEATATPVDATEPPDQTTPSVVTEPVASEPPPSATDTLAPASLNPTGPYIVYGGIDGIWISNPDGSFLTKLTDLSIELHDLRRLISPQGDRLALITANDKGLDLVEVKIPSGGTKTIAHLFSITPDELSSEPLTAKAFTTYAIRDYNNISWQPGEGKFLAFMGAINGSTSDLYVYDTESGEITQLTDGPSQGIFPNWSPDGKYILHYGVSWKGPFGGAILGHDHIDGVWAVQVSDGKVITLPTPKSVSLNFLGWQDDSHYITYDSDIDNAPCISKNLHSVDIVTGKAASILAGGFSYGIARATENQAFLFEGSTGCPEEGTFLLLPGQETPTKLLDQKAAEVSWLPESGVFWAYPDALFSSDGSTRYDPPPYNKASGNASTPAVSPKGYQAWRVIENRQPRVDLKLPGANWRTIFDGGIGEMVWDPVSGETLLFTGEEGHYAASYPDFTPRIVGKIGDVNQLIWLP